MKRAVYILSLVFLAIQGTAFGVVEIDPKAQDMERYLEQKIERHLQQLFPSVPVVVSVKVKFAPPAEKKADNPNSKKIQRNDDDGTFVDLGYLPFPVELSDSEKNITQQTPGQKVKPGQVLRVEGTTVQVQADPSVADDTLKLIDDSITTALEGYAPTVIVKKLGVEGIVKMPERNPTNPSDAMPARDTGEKEPDIFAPIAQVVSAVVLAMAIFFLSLFLRAGATAIAEGIKAMSPGGGAAAEGGSGDSNLGGMLSIAGGKDPMSIKLPIDSGIAYERNHAALRRSLKEKPEIIAQELQASPEDADGLRWLLPSLEPTEQELLREWLGPTKTKQLLTMASAVSGEGADLTEMRHRWLQRFVERVALRRVRGGSPVEDALGAELTRQVSAIGVLDIEEWLMSRNDSAAWRVAGEFVPQERFARLLDKTEGDKWILLADAANTDPKEIATAAKALVESKREKDPKAAKQAEIRSDYFQRVLADPLTSAIKKRPLGEQQTLITQMASAHPDLVKSLEARFWTIDHLARVPAEALEPMFRFLTVDEKVAIIASLPDDAAKRFRSWIPEGNVKLIIDDRVEKTRKRADKQEMAAALEVAQRFIEILRQANISGKFDLAQPGETAATAPQEEIRRAA